jgi:hypothetical protein
MDVKPLQNRKAALPIDVTLEGIVNVVKPQRMKALRPIEVTPSGIVTDVKLLQSSKA